MKCVEYPDGQEPVVVLHGEKCHHSLLGVVVTMLGDVVRGV
jgi:hypothetical protein